MELPDMPTGVSLRTVGREDEPFLFQLYASTRADEMALVNWPDIQKQAFLIQQFQAQQAHYQGYYPEGEHQLIFRDGVPVGRIYLERQTDKIHLLDIAIIPEARSQGLGSAMLRSLLTAAGRAGLNVTLHVYQPNTNEVGWYQRHGFTIIGGSGLYYLMEWRPEV